MTLEEKYQLSLYEKITKLSDDKQIWLVKHNETNEIYVRKELLLYNRAVYEQLKENQFDNVPRVIECVEDENRLIVIEEYIHGKTLESVIQEQGVLSEENAVFVIQSLCDILRTLHHNMPPIVHRDIKPSNIIFSSDGVVKLIDFNAARELHAGQNEDTRLMGTKRFAAPEQYGFGQSDPRTDIYALGVTFYYMLTGDYPDSGKYNGKYHKVIEKCIQLERENRYSSVDALQKAVGRCGQVDKPQGQLSKQYDLGWRRWLPVGFRTGKIWKAFIAIIGYMMISVVGLASTFSNSDGSPYAGYMLWAFRIAATVMMLGCVLMLGNYGGILDHLPFMNKGRLLYMLLAVVYTILWCILCICVLAFFV
ncbi:MAG: serine/threonine protein kinase [Lachnospiraceae bacterium]|nr:serine/threonine protein kinase [Lachnospiraceae bacterium]